MPFRRLAGNIARIAGKIRDGMPIVGLWSRLTATGGDCSRH